jgi:hypothetical protein
MHNARNGCTKAYRIALTENEDTQAVDTLSNISTYPKKRKAITYASKPPLQKKSTSTSAFSYAPLNNFDEVDKPLKPTTKAPNPKAQKEVSKPLAAIDNVNKPKKEATHTTKPTIQKKISSSFAPINNFDEIEETSKVVSDWMRFTDYFPC